MKFTFLKSKTFWFSIVAGVGAFAIAIKDSGLVSSTGAIGVLNFLITLNRIAKDF